MTMSTGSAAADGATVSTNAASGGAAQGSSSTPASIARPNRLSSIENGDSGLASIGIPRSAA